MKITHSNVQDTFLNNARRDKVFLTIFLTNGFQIKGTICSFDNFVVLVDSDSRQNMIYKHAISTIVPFKSIDYQDRKES